MDIFRFTNPTESMKMEQGVFINGLKRKTWIERYDEAGEFTFIAPANVGMRERLPIGSFVSHVNTPEIMIVENHEIDDDPDRESEIKITGRGFETFFDNRIIGTNKTLPASDGVTDFQLTADYLANQVVTLIKKHILASELLNDDNALSFLEILTDIPSGGESVARSIKMGPLYLGVLELLRVGGFGLKIIRPGAWSPAVSSDYTVVMIHEGVDRTSEIIFSQDTGEIENSDYLWSNKLDKNAAFIFGRWVQTTVEPADTGIDRKWMSPVDASDLDQNLSAAPTGASLTNLVNAMQQRGREALASQIDVALTKAEVSTNTNKAAYRKDFFVGDQITVNGAYNETSAMQISEYVEIEDETGAKGYPTLTVV